MNNRIYQTDFLSKVLNSACITCITLFLLLFLCIFGTLIFKSFDCFKTFGVSFINQSDWNQKTQNLSRVLLHKDKVLLLFNRKIDPQFAKNKISIFDEQKKINVKFEILGQKIYIHNLNKKNGLYTIIIDKALLNKPSLFNKIQNDIIWKGTIFFDQNTIISNYSSNSESKYFGILSFILGTLITSCLALMISFPIALSSALFITEYTSKYPKFSEFYLRLIELLATIPSIIYGFWGMNKLVPTFGANLFTASIVLSIMTVPYATLLIRESLILVPRSLKQSALALGAQRYKVILTILLPHAKSGIFASLILTLGRALGETLAVSMVIGNRNNIPSTIFSPSQTLASLIVNEYGEASGMKQSALIGAGLILILITMLFSLLGRILIRYSYSKKYKG